MKGKTLSFILVLLLITMAGCVPMQEQQQPRQQQPNEIVPQQQGQQEVQGTHSSIVGEDVIERVKVIAETATVREGCTQDAEVLQTAAKDNTLDVISKVEGWFAVRLPEDKIGFVQQDQVQPVVVEDEQPAGEGGQQAPQQGNANQQEAQQNLAEAGGEQELTAEEQEMLRLVNEVRGQNNVPPIEADIPLTRVARVKSQDMIDHNYFSHHSPTYGSPFDMMKSFGIHYVKAGENIAGNQDVQRAHESLMNSEGHRANILNPEYTHIGIGIKQGGQYGNMFTQMFISKPK